MLQYIYILLTMAKVGVIITVKCELLYLTVQIKTKL